MDTSQPSFSERLRYLRLENKWTPEECAKLLDIHRSTIVRYEKGDRFPNFQGLIRIAALFSVSTDYLLGITDRRKPQAASNGEYPIAKVKQMQLKDGQLEELAQHPFLDFKKDSDLIFVRITGREYLPNYSSQDLLVFKLDSLPKNGDLILWNRNGRHELRIFHHRSNGIILVGVAPYAPPEWIAEWNQSETAGVLTHVIHGVKNN